MRVAIRPWDIEDAMVLHTLSMHPFYLRSRVWNYLYPDTFLHAISTIHFYQQADPNRFLFQAILGEENVCGFLQCEVRKEGSCELSYWLGVPYWNLGIMKQAVNLMCRKAFQELPVLCIYARVESKNVASIKVLETNGFQGVKLESRYIFTKYK